MGRTGGFLDFSRKEPDYRTVKERLRDYKPVVAGLPEAETRAQAARCAECGTPFCHGTGCPVANIIPEINDLAYRGLWREALDILLSTNNFPEFTSIVCPAPCETSCVLGINDAPVTIRQIERAVIEKGFEKGYIKPRRITNRMKRSVAVIGSGPAGLAVADTLNQQGVNVTVYDRAQSAGGILRYGIPDFKLEKRIVARRVALMEAEGVEFKMGISVGDDVSFNYLMREHDAVCLAGGSRRPRDLDIPGRELSGIHFAMPYLVQQNKRVAGEDIAEPEITADGLNVAIIGGGDTGADCVGTALRQGAKKVYQLEIMPEPPTERPADTPWPTWPRVLRTSSSHEEGGERLWSVSTTEFLGEDGAVKGMNCVNVEWSRNNQGRYTFEEKKDTDFKLDVQLVLISMGFAGPGPNKLVEDLGIARDNNGNISIDDDHKTNVEGVFAAGDMSSGQSLVVRAIADGREAAGDIINSFSNKRTE